MELYRKYRPTCLKDMVGNSQTKTSIQYYLDNKNLPHGLLFTGDKGCGKTTLARILKTELNVDDSFGYIELDATIHGGKDNSRDIAKETQFKPIKGASKLIIIDEAHSFGVGGASQKNQAQTGLLKSFENCPDWCYFILCTTNPEMIIPTLRDRCVQFHLELLSEKEMKILLLRISKKEDIKINKEIIQVIIDSSEGHPRTALQLLSKVSTLKSLEDIQKVIQKELEKQSSIKELCYALLDGKDWKVISKILLGVKTEPPETIRRSILGMMESGLLNGWALNKTVDPWQIMSWFYDKTTYDSGFSGIVFCCKAITDQIETPY